MDFIAGAIAGGVSAGMGYPLDTIKVRIQTQTNYRGIWHCIIDTYRTESVPGFYRGVSMTVVMASFISSISFGIYKNFLHNICKLRYGSGDSKPSKLDISFAGGATGAIRVLLISPAEIAKVRLQIQKEPHSASGPSHLLTSKPKYQGAVHCLRMIVKEEGFGGLYKGSLALLCRDCHSTATYFLTYSLLCEWLTPAGKDRPDLWAVLLSGGSAGVVAWGVATPMDVIKSRMQADGECQRKYSGLMHCARDSIREEGVKVLFKGIGLNSLRAFPANMVVFFTYEAVLRLGKRLLQ
nr:solute carrier family 25 member 47 [Pogona vitticeps]